MQRLNPNLWLPLRDSAYGWLARLRERLSANLQDRNAALESAVQALRESEERYRELVENANDLIYTHDLEGRFTSINKAGQRLSGYSEAEVLGMAVRDFLTPESFVTAMEMLQGKLDGASSRTTYEVEMVARDGSHIPLEVSSRLVLEGGRAVAVQGVARNISDRRQSDLALKLHAAELEALFEQLSLAHTELADSQREIQEKSALLEHALAAERAQARLDSLTGALNHGGVVEELRSLIAARTPAAVFMLDIDAMKAANDMFGHPFGDRVLRATSKALSRDGAVVGRYGGDEFVAVLEGAGYDEAETYRRAVLDALAHSGLVEPDSGNEVQIEASIGFYLYRGSDQRIDEVIAAADKAMYESRRQQPAAGLSARRMGGERVARLVGEIVPLLTAPGDREPQLARVCERLAAECGYDAVWLAINPYQSDGRDMVVSYPALPDGLRERWMKARGGYYNRTHPLSPILRQASRPLVILRAQHDSRLVPFQREMLQAAGLSSMMTAPLKWEGELIGFISVGCRQEGAFRADDAQLLMGIASQVSSIASMTSLVDEFRSKTGSLTVARRNGMRILAGIAEVQAGVLSHDLDRLCNIGEALAVQLGFGQEDATEVGLAAMLHDIGKYRVPGHILSQPQDLTSEEFEVVKGHALWGWRLLQDLPGFELASQVARWHHERWDGHGYPDGLAGDEIPLKVAIATVADALDAMIYDRVYRQGIAAYAAVDEVIAGSASHFNPDVVRALIHLRDQGLLPFDLGRAADDQLAA